MVNENQGDIVKERGINANSILLVILMGISSWVLINQVNTGKDLATIKTSQVFFKETLDELKAQMVKKPELDIKLLDIELKRVEFENRILRTINETKQPTRTVTP